MKHLLVISIIIVLGFGGNVVCPPQNVGQGFSLAKREANLRICRIPEGYEKSQNHEKECQRNACEIRCKPKGLPYIIPKCFDPHIISEIPDLRSTAGTTGKNIVLASDGQSVAVIYCQESGNPDNIMVIYISYSTDRGNSWVHYGPLSPPVRRAYSAVDALDDFNTTGQVHFAWHEAPRTGGSYDTSQCFYTRENTFPDGMFYPFQLSLPKSGRRDVWQPCIGVKDSFVIITAMNNGTYVVTYDCYIWRSTDYGESWDTGRVFLPHPLVAVPPHFRFGSDGYIFFLWLAGDSNRYVPYYCESFDYGLTWTDPQLLWGNTPPYPDMSNVTCSWDGFDCEVVKDMPVVAINFNSGMYDYGETWAYYPDSGGPGHWHFKGVKLVGGDSTAPQTFSRYPTVAADSYGNIFIGYQAIFEQPSDTGPDCGMFIRYAGDTTWYDYGPITFNAMTIEESFLEFAHNAPVIAGGDSTMVGMIYNDAGTYPTSGNLYFDYIIVPSSPGIQEANHQQSTLEQIKVIPNPFHSSVRFILPASVHDAKIAIFDVTGKLVKYLVPTTSGNLFIWDGRNIDGRQLSPGVYFYTVLSGHSQYKGKMVLTK